MAIKFRKSLLVIAVLMTTTVAVGVVAIESRRDGRPRLTSPRKLPGDVAPAIAHSTRLAAVGATETRSVRIILRSTGDSTGVLTYLTQHGFSITGLPTDVPVISATGSVQAIDAAFGVRLYRWHDNRTGREFSANEDSLRLPAALSPAVLGVFGLDNSVVPTPLLRRSSLAIGHLNAPILQYTPQQLQTAYNVTPLLDAGTDGSGVTVAIFAFARGGFDRTKVDAFSAIHGLPAPKLTVSAYSEYNQPIPVPEPGANPKRPRDEQPFLADEREAETDVEAVHTIAPGASIHVYEYPEVDNAGVTKTFVDFQDRVMTDHDSVASMSVGGCETDLQAVQAHLLSALFRRMAQLRISVFAASGDTGKHCRKDGGPVAVEYPASDPYVTAVGGTHLDLTPTNTLNSEQAWDRGPDAASGGGTSTTFVRQCWQTPPPPTPPSATLAPPGPAPPRPTPTPAPKGPKPIDGRQVPDVAADGDGTSGLDVTIYKEVGDLFSGTSLSAPLWAGLGALYDQYAAQHHADPLGWANPMLYQLAGRPSRPLFDVTADDGLTDDLAGAPKLGWDFATGLGSFNAYTLVHDGVSGSPWSTCPPARSATDVVTFKPWVVGPAPTYFGVPRPGAHIQTATGSCDSGSPDDPGRSQAYRCSSNTAQLGVCFSNDISGDPGSPLLCATDPTGNDLIKLTQTGGSQLQTQLGNRDNPNAPPWFLVLADGHKCHLTGTGTNTNVLAYDCGGVLAATVPDRTTTTWSVRESPFQLNPHLGPPVTVTTAFR